MIMNTIIAKNAVREIQEKVVEVHYIFTKINATTEHILSNKNVSLLKEILILCDY